MLAAVGSIEVSASIGVMIVHAAARSGVEPAWLLAATGFRMEEASDPDARIPLDLETALWDEAARLSGDVAFGVHAAESLRPGLFDVMDYVIRAAPTVRAALERVARYNRLLHDAAVFTLVDRGEVTRVEHALPLVGVTQSRHAAEFTIAGIVVIGGQMVEQSLHARAVEFRHAEPPAAAIAEHRRLFGIAPRFSAAVNAIELDRALLELPVPTADPMLLRVVERHAAALLAARPEPTETTANRARRLLAAALGDREGEATLTALARKLRMSERSLQRKLADEGVTFDALLDDLRRDMAVRYLSDRKVAIAEVAYLLGYSEPSAFHRAFKRWTGSTPNEVRQRLS
jgi:AraC-like DNA-binding protein